jgi:hypothetical protein
VDAKAFMLSQPKAKNQTFVSITEIHGGIDPINESVTAAGSNLADLKLISSNDTSTLISFNFKGKTYTYQINYQDKKDFIVLKANN